MAEALTILFWLAVGAILGWAAHQYYLKWAYKLTWGQWDSIFKRERR